MGRRATVYEGSGDGEDLIADDFPFEALARQSRPSEADKDVQAEWEGASEGVPA
jgi:hypothetical protein